MSDPIYILIQPYTGMEDEAHEKALSWCRKLFDRGIYVYSPILLTHIVSKGTSFNDWYNYDFVLYEGLNKTLREVIFLVAPNWEGSVGCNREIVWARRKNIKCYKLIPFLEGRIEEI